jgi:hypothetical protein
VLESTQSIYVLGGMVGTRNQDLIWRLDISSHAFLKLRLRLPVRCTEIPCYRLNPKSTEIFMLLDAELYSLDTTSNQIQLIRTLPRSYRSKHFHCVAGAFYYSIEGPALPIVI